MASKLKAPDTTIRQIILNKPGHWDPVSPNYSNTLKYV